jgi:hypothetical protein
MPTDQQPDFKRQLIAVVDDLHKAGRDDGEAMFLLGRIADTICRQGKQADWRMLKANLTRADYDVLLAEFQREGNHALKEGKGKLAYAFQTLMVALVAKTQTERDVQAGALLLDTTIDLALANYRRRTGARR